MTTSTRYQWTRARILKAARRRPDLNVKEASGAPTITEYHGPSVRLWETGPTRYDVPADLAVRMTLAQVARLFNLTPPSDFTPDAAERRAKQRAERNRRRALLIEETRQREARERGSITIEMEPRLWEEVIAALESKRALVAGTRITHAADPIDDPRWIADLDQATQAITRALDNAGIKY